MAHNLNQQFKNSIFQCLCFGQSKRSLVKQGISQGWRIFSGGGKKKGGERKILEDHAKNFSNWCKEYRPDVRNLVDVTPQVTKAFLEHKANTCCYATLDRYMRRFSKLERVVKHAKNLNICYVDYVKPPIPAVALRKNQEMFEVKRSIPMEKIHLDAVFNNTEDCHSRRAVKFAELFGLRVAETVGTTKGQIDFKNDTIEIIGKHNKHRILAIQTKAQKNFLRNLAAEKEVGDLLIPIKANSVNNWLHRNLLKQNIHVYAEHKTGVHSIRKMTAQRFWDAFRGKHTLSDAKSHLGWNTEQYNAIKSGNLAGFTSGQIKAINDYFEPHTWKETRAATSVFLGHGEVRDDVIDAYVKNAW
ncbi:tyrosine-type recombinase/integrase [Clostridium ganghwense]|uniref:Tyrosine-type recombinase/integrase n=1 Tax=Clostridium ganghwense TaxID=312089 RepID=A0ABT4CUR4_9CLOT|nr:tyrosine-type recombinase/integrase [Clostridium ganghwense]MCY6372801.1 tyrosine-type recombinase/integrase [Clostridium ganghwense]